MSVLAVAFLNGGSLGTGRATVCGSFKAWDVHWPLKALRSPVEKQVTSASRRRLKLTDGCFPGHPEFSRGTYSDKYCRGVCSILQTLTDPGPGHWALGEATMTKTDAARAARGSRAAE